MTEYAEAELAGKILTLRDEVGDREAFVPLASVRWVTVDWLVKNGQIRFCTSDGAHFLVTFDESDHGQACADFVSEVFRQWQPTTETA